MTKLFIASDLKHAKRWIELRPKLYPEIAIVSSWIDLLVGGEPVGWPNERIRQSWFNNIEDINICNYFLFYHEPDKDHLRGALFEAGIAQEMGKPLLFVGDYLSLGPLFVMFKCFASLEQGLEYVRRGL